MAQASPDMELQAALGEGNDARLAAVVAALQPADLAAFLSAEGRNDPALAEQLLVHLTLSERARAFGYLDATLQARVAARLSPTALARLLGKMDADERADLFKLVNEDVQEAALRQMAREEREDLRRLASYEEGTGGALMTSDYVAVPENLTVAAALQAVRSTAPDAETIYQVYIIDHEHRLQGTVSLRELILGLPDQPLDELMRTELVTGQVDTAQEEVARLISRYDLLALPILDTDQRLVGIVTHDDAMDVAAEEATEDMHKAATIGKLHRGIGQSGLLELYRKRIVWLVLLVFANILSGFGIAHFEATIEAYIVLVFFLPLLVDSSGNAGSQAATLMVRGLATGDVQLRHWGRHFGRELLVAGALGLTMAAAVSILGVLRGGPDIAFVVATSMIAVVIMGSLIGMSLPFLLSRVGWDPATASAPLVTSIADAVGVVLYFSIATATLGLPG